MNSNRNFHTYSYTDGFLSFHSLGVSCVFDQVGVLNLQSQSITFNCDTSGVSIFSLSLEISGATEGYDIGKEFRRMKRRMQNLVLFAAVCRSPIACQGRCSPFHLNLENSTVICRSGSHVQIMSHRMSAAKRFHIQQLLSCCLLQPRSVDHQLKEIRGMLTK